MELERRIYEAKTNKVLRDTIIDEYMVFIVSCASKSVGRYVDKSDDAFSIAMLAFNEAITEFNEEKASFLGFAETVIKRRLTDYLRKEYRHRNVVSISSLRDENEEEFDVSDPKADISDAFWEIEALKQELSSFDISFFDLPQASPKSKKTKMACMQVVRYICEDDNLIQAVKKKKTLPSKLLITELNVNEKLIERHRKYIIAGILIMNGNYDVIAEYFCGGVIK